MLASGAAGVAGVSVIASAMSKYSVALLRQRKFAVSHLIGAS